MIQLAGLSWLHGPLSALRNILRCGHMVDVSLACLHHRHYLLDDVLLFFHVILQRRHLLQSFFLVARRSDLLGPSKCIVGKIQHVIIVHDTLPLSRSFLLSKALFHLLPQHFLIAMRLEPVQKVHLLGLWLRRGSALVQSTHGLRLVHIRRHVRRVAQLGACARALLLLAPDQVQHNFSVDNFD